MISMTSTLPDNFSREQLSSCSLPLYISFHFSEQTLRTITLRPYQNLEVEVNGSPAQASQAMRWIGAYVQKKPINLFDEIDTAFLSPFRKAVLSEMAKIPSGQTCTYKELAIRAGNPRAARAVGQACNANPFPLLIPCHRVVAAGHKLGGFAYGESMKLALLHYEGSDSVTVS